MNFFSFKQYEELKNINHIVVDCDTQEGAILTLSHWPKAKTPERFRADTSAESVFKFLQSKENFSHIKGEIYVSNDHFDKDGMAGLFSMINPKVALEHKQLLMDIAFSGDFRTHLNEKSSKVAFILNSYESKLRSPLKSKIEYKNIEDWHADAYKFTLPIFEDILFNLDNYKEYWSDEWQFLQRSLELIDQGKVSISEDSEFDLAVVTIKSSSVSRSDRLTEYEDESISEYAINRLTQCNRIITIHDDDYQFRYRYESWVDFRGRKVPKRVDMSDCLQELNINHPYLWTSPSVNHPYPILKKNKNSASNVSCEVFVQLISKYLGHE